MSKYIGDKYGYLTVTGEYSSRKLNAKRYGTIVVCKCSACGKENNHIYISYIKLTMKKGYNPSCGCMCKSSKKYKKNIYHDDEFVRKLNRRWRSLRDAYNNHNSPYFDGYGAILGPMAQEWNKFKQFYEDVAPSFKGGLVLRPKHEDRPIGPDNFFWGPKKKNGRKGVRSYKD